MKSTYKIFVVFFFLQMAFSHQGRSQEVFPVNDSLSIQDTVPGQKPLQMEEKKSAIEAQIDRSCNDSTIQDFKNNKIFYYGDVSIKYDNIEIQANYIEYE